MILTFEVVLIPVFGKDVHGVRYGVELEKEDINNGLTIEQIKQEMDLNLNMQFDSKRIW